MLINNYRTNRRTRKTDLMRKYKITYRDIARYFGYSNPQSFNSSKAKSSMIQGIDKIIAHVESIIPKYEDKV